jgi:AcrR family transcriptional regulator
LKPPIEHDYFYCRRVEVRGLPSKVRRQHAQARPKQRRRRPSAEIVELLIDAACTEFEKNGYEGATTARIAQKAGVTEALIFSNFGSKAGLFHDAIFNPLNQHFLEFCARHLVASNHAEGARAWMRLYTTELHNFIAEHSRMLQTLIVAQMFASQDVQGLGQVGGLHEFFSLATAKSMKSLATEPKIHPKLISRISFATMLACGLFRDWLFPEGLASEAEIHDAISSFILEGVNANAASRASARSPQ